MLNKNTQALLTILNALINDDSYKVLEKNEILTKFKRSAAVDDAQLQNMLNYLEKTEYLDVNYSDETVYSVALKPKARVVYEDAFVPQTKPIKFGRILFLYSILAGVCAFIGTALAIYIFL